MRGSRLQNPATFLLGCPRLICRKEMNGAPAERDLPSMGPGVPFKKDRVACFIVSNRRSGNVTGHAARAGGELNFGRSTNSLWPQLKTSHKDHCNPFF